MLKTPTIPKSKKHLHFHKLDSMLAQIRVQSIRLLAIQQLITVSVGSWLFTLALFFPRCPYDNYYMADFNLERYWDKDTLTFKSEEF